MTGHSVFGDIRIFWTRETSVIYPSSAPVSQRRTGRRASFEKSSRREPGAHAGVPSPTRPAIRPELRSGRGTEIAETIDDRCTAEAGHSYPATLRRSSDDFRKPSESPRKLLVGTGTRVKRPGRINRRDPVRGDCPAPRWPDSPGTVSPGRP